MTATHKLTAATKSAVFAVFNDADNASASFADRLFTLGVADRATAAPLAMEWAAKKYDATIEQGQRGDKLPRNSAAERAYYRVLDLCFPRADKPAKAAKGSARTDKVERLLAEFLKLEPGQKRSFRARLAAL